MYDVIVFRTCRVFSALFAVLFLCLPVLAQDYQVHEVKTSLKSNRSVSKVSLSLRRGFAGAADKALFDKVCDNYTLPMWTQPSNHHQLPRLRQKFRSQLLKAKDTATRTHFNNHLLDKLSKMASGNYHPAVRYNCMLLLGELDSSPPARIGSGEQATPLPDALPLLLAALDDGQQIDAVRVAALVGIARHGRLLRDDATRRRISDAMLKLAATKSTPGTSAAGQAWMRVMAIDTLGCLESAGEQNATLEALLEIVDDVETPLAVRCAAARAVGNLDISKPDGLDPDAIVRQLGRLAMAACKTEIEECKEKNRTISPRTLNSRLLAVRMGLMGTVNEPAGGAMSLLKEPEEKQNATAIREQIDRWLEMLDDQRLIKKLEPEQEPGARPGMGMGMGGMEMGMGRSGMRPPGAGMPEEEDKQKTASDEVIAKIIEDLKSFAVLVQ